jgi:glutaredoxin-related protein
MTALGAFIVGKIIFYYFWELVDKGMKYFSSKPDYKKPVRDILDSLSNNKRFIDDVTNMIDSKRGIDNSTADKIVKLPYVQTQITKIVDSRNGELEETEIENQLKTIFLKSWGDKSITDRAIEKVKKDIK